MKDRQEMIEKGKTLFKTKSGSGDEVEIWKESSLKYQAKYEESVQINQEIKLLLESCLSAKEALIRDLAAANELIFQNDLQCDSKRCTYASKATQTVTLADSVETQTEHERDVDKTQKGVASVVPLDALASVVPPEAVALPVSTQTESELANSNENLETTKNQLSHIRDAYERAQSQMQMLGNANAQLKVDLENEKKISALLEGTAFPLIIAEVNTLPDYIQKYHAERKTLLEKLVYEREKVSSLTEKIQQLSKLEIVDVEKLTKTNESIESVKTPSPLAPVSSVSTPLINPSKDMKSPKSAENIKEGKVEKPLKSPINEQSLTGNDLSPTKEQKVSPSPGSNFDRNSPKDQSNINESITETKEKLKSPIQEDSPKNSLPLVTDVVQENVLEAPLMDQDQSRSVTEKVALQTLEEQNITMETMPIPSNDADSTHISPSKDQNLKVETSSKTKNVVTPLVSPDIKSVSSTRKDPSSATENIPLALLYGQSICYNCQYYKDIKL